MRPKTVSEAVIVGLVLVSRVSFATPAEDDAALAETLFRGAKQKMAASDYAAACPMLAESQRLDPGGGTLLTLGLCHEAEGRTASAWTELQEALVQARSAGNTDRASVAQKHLQSLEPRLCRLRVDVAKEAAAIVGLAVTRDDVVLAPPAWGLDVPVDPGAHTVKATAAGHVTWTVNVDVARPGERRTVVVSALTPEPSAAPSASSSIVSPPAVFARDPAIESSRSWMRGGAYTDFAFAGGAVIVGGYFALKALSEHHDARAICPDKSCPDKSAVDLDQTSNSHANTATVAFVLAAIAGGAGATLFALSPAVELQASAGPGGASGSIRGRF